MEDSDTNDSKTLDQDDFESNGNAGIEGPDSPGSLCPEYETDEGHPGESDLIHNTPMTTHIKQEVIDDDLQYETTEYDPMEDMSHEGFLSHEDQKLKLDYRHEALLSKSSKRISPTANNKTRRRPRKDKLLDTNSEEMDPADTIRVTCGHLTGLLHKELFYCPGIHRACVELDDGSATFVTPKRFMFMGEKARLKDWKNAIRWNGHQLRKHIEAGTLAFYKHEELCTGRCMARSPFATRDPAYMTERAKLRREKFEFETLGFSSETDGSGFSDLTADAKKLNFVTTVEENGCMKIQSVSGGDESMWNSIENNETDTEPPDIKPDVKQLQIQMMNSMQNNKVEPVLIAPKPQVSQNMPTSLSQTQVRPLYSYKPRAETQKTIARTETLKTSLLPPSIMNAVMPPVSENDSNAEEDRLLWQGIVELGLIDEFFREIKASLDLLKNTMVKRLVPLEDSNRISIIVRQLGLMQKLKFKLEAHRTDMEKQRRRLDREMIDLQKKVQEYEIKKKVLEKRSECFEQILEIPAMKNNSSTSPAVFAANHGPPRLSPNQKGTYILSSAMHGQRPGSIVTTSLKAVTTNSVSQSQNSPGTCSSSAIGKNGRVQTGPGGTKILVFPKQNTEFHSNPNGSLKITLKRKQDFSDDETPTEMENDSQLKSALLSKGLKSEENKVESNDKKESVNDSEIQTDTSNQDDLISKESSENCTDKDSVQEEINPSHDELNSSHEEIPNAHSCDGDQTSEEKTENAIKRSKRRRSVKTYSDDYIK
ncbi:glucocorticoid modulatory element-binding protein 1-like [Mytilus edulis]|uniref:glucocorticoid modulatory element-binding protein 1-like n=1 Tax=Mytilus edulis TaxID=6550 RepID=UPI0039F0020B